MELYEKNIIKLVKYNNVAQFNLSYFFETLYSL